MITTPSQQAALERLAALVAASPHNLVSRSARAELLTRHVPECVALGRLLPAGEGRLLDIGSGGGFPGIVIAIMRPDLEVHLLDSTRKKTGFLQETAQDIGADVVVHTGRAEDLTRPPLADSFDLVTARAVARLERLLPWALPFLRQDGVLYAVKGKQWERELREAAPTLARVGARVLATPDDVPADQGAEQQPRVVMIARGR